MNELTKLLESDEWPPRGTVARPLGWFDVAELPLPSGLLWIGDPGFSWAELAGGDGNRLTLEPGQYAVRAFVMNFGEGNFVARLRVISVGSPEPTIGKELAQAGTDSALIGVCDANEMRAAYLAKFAPGQDLSDSDLSNDTLNEGAEYLEEHDFQRSGILRVEGADSAGLIYVASGFGDGGGRVLELLDGERRIGVELPFIEVDGTT